MALLPCCPQHADRDVQPGDGSHAGIAAQYVQESSVATTHLESRPLAIFQSKIIDSLPYGTIVTAELIVVCDRHAVPLPFVDCVAAHDLVLDQPRNSWRPYLVVGRATAAHKPSHRK